MLVDVLLEAFITNIHLPQAGQYLPGAGIAAFGDLVLQLLYQILGSFFSGRSAVFHTTSKFAQNGVQTDSKSLPLGLPIVLCLFRMLLVRVGAAPARLRFGLVHFKFCVFKCIHHKLSFCRTIDCINQPFQSFFFQHQKPSLLLQRFVLVIVRRRQQTANAFQRKLKLPVKENLLHPKNRLFVIKAIACGSVNFSRTQQTDLIVIMQRAHADTCILRKFFDLHSHVITPQREHTL